MNDRERLIKLLKDFGVQYEEENGSISCTRGDKGVGGYIGFYVEFNFDEDGKFENMGVWE